MGKSCEKIFKAIGLESLKSRGWLGKLWCLTKLFNRNLPLSTVYLSANSAKEKCLCDRKFSKQ